MTEQNFSPVAESETPQPETPQPETAAQRLPSLLAALLALVAWVALLFSNGYIAIAVAVVAAVVGFIAAHKGWRSLATAAIIASLVLIVVTGAFIIVINYVL